MKVAIKCSNKNCENIHHYEERTRPRKEIIIGRNVCKECREKHIENIKERERRPERRKANSERMKETNPMYKPEVRAKVAQTTSGKETNVDDYLILKRDLPRETKEELSQRMKEHNPMSNLEIRERMATTFKEKVQSGEIVYKKGPEHHLWKGNRTFSATTRSLLYPVWTYKILESDNFTCRVCKENHADHVHHIKPFREFVSELKERHDLKNFHDLDDNKIFELAMEIVNAHKLEHGISVCKKCHEEIDPHFFY